MVKIFFIVVGGVILVTILVKKIFSGKKKNNPSTEFKLTDEMIIRFANLKGGIISAQELSSQTSLNREQAQFRLEELVKNGYAQLRVSDNGNILFDFKQNMIGTDEKKNSQLL